MIAIVDCNSFYCSCERLFRPDLDKKPVVVLSNNDGCIIAISDEAKALGIVMGTPYFQSKELIKQHNIATFSSNYNLYGNLSWRVMETLRTIVGSNNTEVYSVDESFLNLSHIPLQHLEANAKYIKQTVEDWTGIKVSVGIGPTKVLSKVANRLSKKNKQVSKCVMILDTPEKIEDALKRTPVNDIWGIGRQYAYKLLQQNITTAYDLSKQTLNWAHNHLGGVVGVRLLRELKGEPCINLKDGLITKKMIGTSRMFGIEVTDLASIKEAIATYISRAAEKLRRQHSIAQYIEVYLISKETQPIKSSRHRHGPKAAAYTILPVATNATNILIKPAVQLAEQLYKAGNIYKKAGIVLGMIVPENTVQGNLFSSGIPHKQQVLMNTIDNVNFSMRNDIIRFGTSGTTRNWKMQQNFHSPRYTTRWDELYLVK